MGGEDMFACKGGTGERPVRVLIAKVGLDGHEAGAKVIARALREAGMEVIYTGLRLSAEEVVNTAIEEDVDVVGLSCLSGAHTVLFPRVAQLLRQRGAEDIRVIGGGTIPKSDVPGLLQAGIRAVFGPGSSLRDIVDCVRTLADERRRGGARQSAPSADGGQ